MEEKSFVMKLDDSELSKRVRAVMGVPEGLLDTDTIVSPVFIKKTERYINKQIEKYINVIEDFSIFNIAAVYYIAYLLCPGMDARLPKQMENLSTKTILSTISWDQKALEFLDSANDAILSILEEFEEDDINYYLSFAELTDESSYPESNI